ncbi:MAG TPA: hypothetical protein VGM73_13840 [Candidatus Didemnitutus sp.]|jgi:hypothetical protein
MLESLRFSTRGAGAAAALLALLLITGCESDHPDQANRRPHLPPPPPLAGQETFFNGQVLAEIKTGAGFGDAGKPDDATPSTGNAGHHGGGGHMGGGRHGRGGGGGSSGDSSGGATIEQDEIANIRRAAAAGGPPMLIHLRFTNHGPTHVDLSVVDFLSELGNFVVQPETVSLDPQQSVEVDPMTSRLVAEAGEANITLVLRSSTHTEKKTIALAPVPAPPGSPAEASPPAAAPADK